MKKVTLLILSVVLASAFGAVNLMAQASEMDLFVNLGVLTDDKFKFNPFLWSGGLNLDINLGSMLMVSPECHAVFQEFKFDTIWLVPGGILNVRYGLIFAGAGITKWLKLTGTITNPDLQLKINAGFKGQKYRLVAFLETPFNDLFAAGTITFGAAFGFKF